MKTCLYLLFIMSSVSFGQIQTEPFGYMDVFELEWASDPQISPDGQSVVYKRNGFDIMKDASAGNLWMVDINGRNHRKLTSADTNESNAAWSPDGKRIAFTRSSENGSEVYVYWLESGHFARISQLEKSPGNLTWSPDGNHISFTMFVSEKPPVVADLPQKPKGADWAEPARITDRLKHEADGRGYLEPGYTHIFVLPSDGGTPRQLTSGNYNHNGDLAFSSEGKEIFFSSNRNKDWEYDFRNSEIYKVNIETKNITQLTDRNGPDSNPVVSPKGDKIAFLSFEDKVQTYQLTQVYTMNLDGSNRKLISGALDRSVSDIKWDSNGNGLYFTYDDKGNSKVAHIGLDGKITNITGDLGGTSIGRPYGSGSYSVSSTGAVVYTKSRPQHPAELYYVPPKRGNQTQLTNLNQDLLKYRELGKVEQVWYKSSVDGRDIQGWIVKPPQYDASKEYPLLVENHGGPIANYGDRFSAEMQLYAADGYLVFYPNPRGSTSYGEEFGNLLYHNYPGDDYNDVMDGVDYLINKGLADPQNLYVTGGSAGGIMTAWIIGKNNRFKAAVVHKPVMNWI
ncbi:MAG: S9 family peptidase, partial [Flavobacteriaceae bacterium]|nr:S9 family peptidase [Flavobacteriaceae bacterium]